MSFELNMGFCNRMALLTVLFGLFFTNGLASPLDVRTVEGQKAWLIQYKYLGKDSIIPGIASLTSDEGFVKAVKMLQRFLGLRETGDVDEETITYMQKTRCGMDDFENVSMFTKRKRRYVLQGSQYPPGKTLTYRINIYSSKFSRNVQDLIFRTAFGYWSRVADIKFQQITDHRKVDIDIMFTTGSHGDYEAFDGQGGILAHAFFPSYGGDEHFDDDEYWTHQQYGGTNLFQTVTHEIGHTLGLSHSNNPNSIMYPYIKPYDPNFNLGNDDIMGIQRLYGPAPTYTNNYPTPAPSNTPPTMAPPPRPPPTQTPPRSPVNPHDTCYDGGIDAITRTKDGNTYIFRGDYVYQINGLGVQYGYPVRIDDPQYGFSPMTGKIDAALYWPTNGKTYLFKDYYVAAFDGRTFDRYHYAEDILDLPPEAKGMSTVFHWPRNGRTYLTKGDLYWRFETGTGRLDPGYPQPMSKWSLPGGVDAAFEYTNGRTYFFKGNQYYKFDDANIRLDSGYPRPINYWWFGCRSNAASSGIIQPESTENKPQMHIIDPVDQEKVNPFTEGESKNQSPRTQGSAALIAGLFLCLSLWLNNILT